MDRGKWLKEKIDSAGFNLYEISDMLGFSRTTLYRYLNDPELPYTKMKPVADLLEIDLRDTFPDTKVLYNENKIIQNDKYPYSQLLDMYAAVVEELNVYKRLYGELPGQKRD